VSGRFLPFEFNPSSELAQKRNRIVNITQTFHSPISVLEFDSGWCLSGVADPRPQGGARLWGGRERRGTETNFPRDIAEAALAHMTGDKAERAYRRGDALEKRRSLMTAWEAFLTKGMTGQEPYLERKT
jgi:hypothetical protein